MTTRVSTVKGGAGAELVHTSADKLSGDRFRKPDTIYHGPITGDFGFRPFVWPQLCHTQPVAYQERGIGFGI
jgi:hypothetical protein